VFTVSCLLQINISRYSPEKFRYPIKIPNIIKGIPILVNQREFCLSLQGDGSEAGTLTENRLRKTKNSL
jgi:hypothetical protein